MTKSGELREGKFGWNKYDLFDNNCVHFVREFAEALMDPEEIKKA